tara:strand:+ start:3070 stop:4689 length:1620 start_codon:yes stop_codon:yes gene_type:complete
MKQIVFIADFFVNQIAGGGEICDDVLISMLKSDNVKVIKLNCNNVIDKHIKLYRECGFKFIISNFCNLREDAKQELIKYPGCYSIMEHDHKYLRTRDPSVFKDFVAPSNQIINRLFYANAKVVFAQSKLHKQVIDKNLNTNNVISLGMNLWTDEQLTIIESNIDNEKKDDFAIVNSKNPTKNTHDCVAYCVEKNLEHTLIGSPDYAEFIKQLSSHKKYLYFPKVLETFNRVIVEARMLNCKVMTTQNNGCLSEDWFAKYRGKELIEFVREQRQRVYNDIKNAIYKKTRSAPGDANVTVILNAYRRPYNLKMQIEAIRNQTVKPKQIWLWVNAHADNEGFDFNSLDVDRIFHNNFNWKFYGRFAGALLADTEYLALFDDDTVPGSKWLENCMDTMQTHEGILGSAGVILNDIYYIKHDRCGWPTQNSEVTEVDLVGHAWFFKREWLRYLWQEKPTTWDNGEDIQFAFMAKIHGGIPTYCPPHPPDDKEMHGSILGNELGIDNKATSTNSNVSHQQFFSERDMCVQAGLRKGWQTVRNIKL